MIRTFLQLDQATIDDAVEQRIRSNHADFTQVASNVNLVAFDPLVFGHASLLLGQHPNRFGYDLSMYLSTLDLFFQRTGQGGLLTLGSGSSDFKRRMSEDIGVGLASLFMVMSFQIGWETIAQIPQNRKLSKFTPDFLSFSSDERFVFEAKGTTRPDKVEDIMNKALTQSKSYPEDAQNKFAIVSYFPGSSKQVPPFTFVADPAISDIMLPDRAHALWLHYLKVMEYAGLRQSQAAYAKLLSAVLSAEKKERGAMRSAYMPYEVRGPMAEAKAAYQLESDSAHGLDWQGRAFIGRLLKAEHGEQRVSVFLGVDRAYIARVLALGTDLAILDDLHVEDEREKVSVFADGPCSG